MSNKWHFMAVKALLQNSVRIDPSVRIDSGTKYNNSHVVYLCWCIHPITHIIVETEQISIMVIQNGHGNVQLLLLHYCQRVVNVTAEQRWLHSSFMFFELVLHESTMLTWYTHCMRICRPLLIICILNSMSDHWNMNTPCCKLYKRTDLQLMVACKN